MGCLILVIAASIGAIFFYRNNKAKLSKYADKVDELTDELKKKE